jgi:hypothetical protein
MMNADNAASLPRQIKGTGKCGMMCLATMASLPDVATLGVATVGPSR